MGIAEPETALEKLREFHDLLLADEGAIWSGSSQASQARRAALQPLIERIADELDPDSAEHLGGRWNTLMQSWTLSGASSATRRLIGRSVGPTMCRTARPTEGNCGNEHR